VRAARPDVLLVGLGAPKQEKWILERKASLCVPVCIGVGGSFEMAAGMVRRAPQWMQRSGLEWSFRLMQDPTRLWRRYLCRDLPVFVSLAARCAFSRGRDAAAPVTQPEPSGKGAQHPAPSARIKAADGT
jgi:N-acetylglucosaminyldiphosphoundecaprenol N-acetyl-beta-D-mannosaminyltransferase